MSVNVSTTPRSRLLVTGASGFVGSALLHRLRERGYSPLGASRATTKSDSILVSPSLGADADWRPLVRECDVVIHAAARAHQVRDSLSNPLAAFREVNVVGTMELARQAAELGVRRFVYLSSIKVNGEETQPGKPFVEGDPPQPADPYGISKAEAEAALLRLAETTGMEVVIVRPPLVYGPGVKANFLNMMHWVYKSVPLPFGAINNRRSFVSIENLVDFIVVCLEQPAAANQVFQVSDGDDISTTELLQRVADALEVPSRLLPVPQKLVEACLKGVGKSELSRRLCGSLQLDISKARTVLGWRPPLSVSEGLHRTAEFFLRGQS